MLCELQDVVVESKVGGIWLDVRDVKSLEKLPEEVIEAGSLCLLHVQSHVLGLYFGDIVLQSVHIVGYIVTLLVEIPRLQTKQVPVPP